MMGRGDVKKQDQGGVGQSRSSAKGKVTTATADQLREAQLMDESSGMKVDSDKVTAMVKNVIDVTKKSEEQVSAALHECNYDDQKAIDFLLEGDGDDDEWTSVTSRKKQPQQQQPAGFGSAQTFAVTDGGVPPRHRNGRGKTSEMSSFGAPAHTVQSREDHNGSAGGRGGRWVRGNGRGGASGRGRQFPAGRGGATRRAPLVEEDADSKQNDGGVWSSFAAEKSGSGVWGASGNPGSWPADPKPTTAAVASKKLTEEPDRWSTDVNATPRIDRLSDVRSELVNSTTPALATSWADATATPTSSNAGIGGSGTGWATPKNNGSSWLDDVGSPVKAAWPSATGNGEKQATSVWPATPSAIIAGGNGVTDGAAAGSKWAALPRNEEDAHIESWRADVAGHADQWTAPEAESEPEPAAAEYTEEEPVPAGEQPVPVEDGRLVVELPITTLESHHMTFPRNQPEVITTAMFIKRPQIPTVPVEMPPLRHVLQDVSRIQFGDFQNDPPMDERHEYATGHQTSGSPSSPVPTTAMEGLAVSSPSPAAQNLAATSMESPMAGMYPMATALSHIRPPPGHAPLTDNHQMVADNQAMALLELNQGDLAPSPSGAIPIPGAGGRAHSSSAHSTPVGSLGTGAFDNVGSAPGQGGVVDPSTVSHQSPLVHGTPPIGAIHTAPSPVTLGSHNSPLSAAEARASPKGAGSPFRAASPPEPIALPPSQQQQQAAAQVEPSSQPQQQQQQQVEPKPQPTATVVPTTQNQTTHSSSSGGASGTGDQQHRHSSSHHSSNQSQHQHHHNQHHHQSHHHHHHGGSGGGSAGHHHQQQQSHSGHSQPHSHQSQQQQQQQQTSNQSSSTSTQHHGPTGAPPGINNHPLRMAGIKSMPQNLMMGPSGPGYMPNYMGVPMVPGFSDFDQQQRNLAMSGVRDGTTNYPAVSGADAKYVHDTSTSTGATSILGTPGAVNFMPQQQMLGYYPSMYMPMLPFHAAMYGGYPPVPKGSHFSASTPSYIPQPGHAAPYGGQAFEDMDAKSSSYQTPSQAGSKASNTQGFNAPAGGNLASSYNKSHYDKLNFQGSSSGIFPAPGNTPTQVQANAMAAYQQLAMLPGLAPGTGMLPGQPLHSQYHAVLDSTAGGAGTGANAGGQSQQVGGRGGVASGSQLQSGGSGGGGSSGPKHHGGLNAGASNAAAGMMKHSPHGFNPAGGGNWS